MDFICKIVMIIVKQNSDNYRQIQVWTDVYENTKVGEN